MGGGHAPAEAPETGPDQLIARFLSGRPQATARAYTAESKMVRTRVATQGVEDVGTLVSRSRR